MSAIAESHFGETLHMARGDLGVAGTILATLRRQRRLFIVITFAFPVVFYLVLLAIMALRFGHLPNYVTPYNWFANVARIIAGTNSITDMVPIILDEWLLEIGYMNYDYGNGIAEWSLSIIPHKLAIITLVGALIGLNTALIAEQQPFGTAGQQCAKAARSGLMAGIGAFCTSLTSVTLFSVVCCATPTWVTSMAILGIGTSTAFAIEPYGAAGAAGGIVLLTASAILIVRDNRAAAGRNPLQSANGVARC